MIVGFSSFGDYIYEDIMYHDGYNKLEITSGLLDHLYVDGNTDTVIEDKPVEWGYTTILNADFKNSLEAGSVKAGGVKIEKIRFQKRSEDELEWQDIGELMYNSGTMLYEMIDKYIAKGETYKYSLIPVTPNIYGGRVESATIVADFDGVFISDKDYNYSLLYDIEVGQIIHNTSSALFEPQYSRFPKIIHSSLNYISFPVTATFVTAETVDLTNSGRGTDVRSERLGKDSLLKFMTNGKPKVYRDKDGLLKLVSVVGKPEEIPFNTIAGISKLSFQMVEIGHIDSETLKANDMLVGISEVF